MKFIFAALMLTAALFAQADGTTSSKTDFPAELLSVVDGMSFPRLSQSTTGGAVKTVANNFALVETSWTSKEKIAKKRFFHALGEVLEIADKPDFTKLAQDFGYTVYSGENTSRKIDITGFFNRQDPPTVNDTVSRVCNMALTPLENARNDLDSYLSLNWNGTFAMDIKILGYSLLANLADVELYIDSGDVTMLRGIIKALEGALYFARGFDVTQDYLAAETAVEILASDVMYKGKDPRLAFDASSIAHFSVKSTSDLQTAKSMLQSAIADLKAGDALLKARTNDGKEHLLQYPSADLEAIVQAVIKYQDSVIACIDQLITPVSLSGATVAAKSLQLTYTGAALSPEITGVTVGGAAMPYELTGTLSAVNPGSYELTVTGYGRSTGSQKVVWSIVVPPPSVSGDEKAEIQSDGNGGYVISPSADRNDVVITIPVGVDAAKVTVKVSPSVKSVKPNGAMLDIVRNVANLGNISISSCLDIPAPNAQGVVDLSKATVKEEIVRETLDVKQGATISLNPDKPVLTTATTRPGLVYTLVEGFTLDSMGAGDSTVGNGSPWTPTPAVKGKSSGFYYIRVTK